MEALASVSPSSALMMPPWAAIRWASPLTPKLVGALKSMLEPLPSTLRVPVPPGLSPNVASLSASASEPARTLSVPTLDTPAFSVRMKA